MIDIEIIHLIIGKLPIDLCDATMTVSVGNASNKITLKIEM